MSEKNQKLEKRLPDFDPDFSPEHLTNREAAEERGWRFNSESRYYVDKDGCLMADEYGQPF